MIVTAPHVYMGRVMIKRQHTGVPVTFCLAEETAMKVKRSLHVLNIIILSQ